MKINKLKSIGAMLVISSLVSCGGGGGGGGNDDVPQFAGVYDVTAVKVSDTCNAIADSFTTLVHTVNQDGRRIVLDSGRTVMSGTVTADNKGFDVTTTQNSDGCTNTIATVYRPSDSADYGVGFAFVSRCGADECTASFGGVANKR